MQQDFSQMAMAEQIDVARQTISHIESNKYNLSLDLFRKLAHALHTDLNTSFW